MATGKVVVGVVSIILVVGVVIGCVVGVVAHNNKPQDGDNFSATSKAVASMCEPTDYKKECVQSMKHVANNQTATPDDYLQAAIEAAITEVSSALRLSVNIGERIGNGTRQKMAMDDCQDLLQFAIDELQASFSFAGDKDLHTMTERQTELRNWLSAVISYQQTCLDGVEDQATKTEMSDGLFNATQLTSNALAIVSKIDGILKAFNISIDLKPPGSRKLLETSGNFPSWMSTADRKLLANSKIHRVKPHAVVAKDGSGQFKTIGAALAAYPSKHRGRYIIHVKAGVYKEHILINKNQPNVFMYGAGPHKTIVTGRLNYAEGTSTYQTATFAAVGPGFLCKAMGFKNTAGPQGHQAVALRVQSDKSAFFNCRMDGYQDTLYIQTHRQFYRNCAITGTVDFIFGDGSVVIQNSQIILRKPMDGQKNTVTAHGRADKNEPTGLVIQNCNIVPERILFPSRFKTPSYLGRPWKQYSRTVFMESTIGDFIQPAGWLEWTGNFALDTLYYAEYANTGPGANTARRVKWKGYKVIRNRNEAEQFTAGRFLQLNTWLPVTGIPFYPGFKA